MVSHKVFRASNLITFNPFVCKDSVAKVSVNKMGPILQIQAHPALIIIRRCKSGPRMWGQNFQCKKIKIPGCNEQSPFHGNNRGKLLRNFHPHYPEMMWGDVSKLHQDNFQCSWFVMLDDKAKRNYLGMLGALGHTGSLFYALLFFLPSSRFLLPVFFFFWVQPGFMKKDRVDSAVIPEVWRSLKHRGSR